MDANLVIGGQGKPQVYIGDQERAPQRTFEGVVTVAYSNASGAIVDVTDNPFGDKALRVTAGADDGRVQFSLDTTGITEVQNTAWFTSLILKTSSSKLVKLYYGNTTFSTKTPAAATDITVNGYLQTSCYVSAILHTGTVCRFAIELQTNGDVVDIYFMSSTKVLSSILFDEDQEYELSFVQEKRSEIKLASGELKTYVQGWRPVISLNYDYLTAVQEVYRSQISEGAQIILFPRNGSAFHIYAMWKDDYERRYVENKMVGHSGAIPVISRYVYYVKPTDIL